jgi:hypothetical protein
MSQSETSSKSGIGDQPLGDVVQEAHRLRVAIEKIYSLLWWSSVFFFGIVVTLTLWLLSHQDLAFVIKTDFMLVAAMAVGFVLFRCGKWLFADVSSNPLQAQVDFVRPQASVEEKLVLILAPHPASGT